MPQPHFCELVRTLCICNQLVNFLCVYLSEHGGRDAEEKLNLTKLILLIFLLFLVLPTGAYFWLLFLPAWVLFVILQGNLTDPSLINAPPPLPPLDTFWDAQALCFVILWILFQALLYILPVGKVSEKI